MQYDVQSPDEYLEVLEDIGERTNSLRSDGSYFPMVQNLKKVLSIKC